MRTDPLTDQELAQYHSDGFIFPIRVLADEQVAELREAIYEHLTGQIKSERYELTDPIRIRRTDFGDGQFVLEYEEDGEEVQTRTFPFLFNLWKSDERFAKIGRNPTIAGFARQILDCREVLLMEDNAVIKNPRTKMLPWHQDYSYWPLAEPAAVTVWIALDHVSARNGAMQVVPGSHLWGERLPVAFGDEQAFMHEERPGVEEVPKDPAAQGHPIVTYELQPGECGLHSAMLWHASTPNESDQIRTAFILRYLASGTVWLGATRMPYDDIGCSVGEPVTGAHFRAVPTAF